MAKVVVALSGGVDSSVAAALLCQSGYEVIGVSLKLWSEPGCEYENRCCTPESRRCAKELSDQINIPFIVEDASEYFFSEIVQRFLDGYSHGDTPNPCVFCNQRLKWGLLLNYAQTIGADFIATGHYAKVIKNINGKYELWKGSDESKDQSYFLSLLNQDQLSHTIFPLANYDKTQVRKIAHDLHLPSADMPESQDLCFLGNRDYRSFLADYAPQVINPGKIVDLSGDILGIHQGLALYTIGQRKGLPSAKEALYVIDKDIKNNWLVVGHCEALGKKEMIVEDINWISGGQNENEFSATVKIRFKASPESATVILESENRARVIFQSVLKNITPGQLAAFYKGDMVLGGGIITR